MFIINEKIKYFLSSFNTPRIRMNYDIKGEKFDLKDERNLKRLGNKLNFKLLSRIPMSFTADWNATERD